MTVFSVTMAATALVSNLTLGVASFSIFAFALLLRAVTYLHEKLRATDGPQLFRGLGIGLPTAGPAAMALQGLTGSTNA